MFAVFFRQILRFKVDQSILQSGLKIVGRRDFLLLLLCVSLELEHFLSGKSQN